MKEKRIKKLLSGMLQMALIISMFTVPAKADDVINTSTNVSLTIHRYEYNGNKTLQAGTGETSDAANIPTGSTPLDGIGYTVYKIADISQDNSVSIKYNVLSDLQTAFGSTTIDASTSGKTLYDMAAVKTVLDGRSAAKALDANTANVTAEKFTSSGSVTFSNSELSGQGLYLVVETTTIHTQTADPFLVSLPTTTGSGEEWLYEVHAYPKTATNDGEITIKKNIITAGTTGAGTAIDGASFYIQKETSPGSGVWNIVTADKNAAPIGTAGLLTITDASAGVTVAYLPTGSYRVVEVSAPAESITDSSLSYPFTIDASGNVTSSSANFSSEVFTIKNEVPTVEKKVLKKGGNINNAGDWADVADYNIGTGKDDKITFQVAVTIPSNIDKLKTYKMVDEFDSAQFNQVVASDVDIIFYSDRAAGTTVAAATLGFNKATAFSTGATGWTIDLSSINNALKTNNVKEVVVNYTTTLKSTAVIAGEGNINTGKVEFTNHIYPISDPQMPVQNPKDGSDQPYEDRTIVTDQAAVYTFGLGLVKSFEGGDTSSLHAKFDLYRKAYSDESGTTIGGVTNLIKLNSTPYETGNDGKISITGTGLGLANGTNTYYFVETETADGYNLLKEPVAADVNITYSKTAFLQTITVNRYNSDGTLKETLTSTTTTQAATATSYEGGSGYTQASVGVVNKKGFTLPKTGGRGTLIFTIIGLVLMAGGVGIYFKGRKKKAN